jgi:hypothetical protein
MNTMVVSLVSLLVMALSCGPVAAWSHAGAWGTASGGGGSWTASGYRGGSASGGEGSWSGTGFRGGTASGGGGSWSATGAYGGSASGGGGSWHATSSYGTTAYGTTAYGGYHYYGGTYATYHPPTTVNYYGSSCYNCGGWSTAGAAAAGAAVGMAAGAAMTSSKTAAATSSAYASGYAAGSAASPAYAMGAIYPTLPAGCHNTQVSGGNYYLCGNTWFQPSFGANGVYYRVVPAP